MLLRYCCAHLLNYTVPVPYLTVRYIGPSASSACTTVLHSYRTLLQTLFSVLVEVQYSSEPYDVFPQVRYCCAHLLNYGTGTVPQCTVLRPLSCLYLLYEYCTVLYCTVLYCTVLVPYFISNNILRAGRVQYEYEYR